MENVGEKILSLRKEKHVSQEQLAERLDVARQTVSLGIGILSFTVFTTLIAIYSVKLIKKRKNK